MKSLGVLQHPPHPPLPPGWSASPTHGYPHQYYVTGRRRTTWSKVFHLRVGGSREGFSLQFRVFSLDKKLLHLRVGGSREGISLHFRVFSLDKKLSSTLFLFTLVYKRVPATCHWGQPCNGLASHPWGSSNNPSCFTLKEPAKAPLECVT